MTGKQRHTAKANKLYHLPMLLILLGAMSGAAYAVGPALPGGDVPFQQSIREKRGQVLFRGLITVMFWEMV